MRKTKAASWIKLFDQYDKCMIKILFFLIRNHLNSDKFPTSYV